MNTLLALKRALFVLVYKKRQSHGQQTSQATSKSHGRKRKISIQNERLMQILKTFKCAGLTFVVLEAEEHAI